MKETERPLYSEKERKSRERGREKKGEKRASEEKAAAAVSLSN